MTGKTHVAIGLAAVTNWGIIQPKIIETYPNLLIHHELSASVAIQFLTIVVAVWLGSLAPDLDQPGSTLSRDIGGPLGTTKATALIGGMGLLYLSSHMPTLLARIPYLEMGFVTIGCILIMMAVLKHRGLTHSVLGMGLIGVAVYWGLHAMLIRGVSYAPSLLIPFLIGYGAHLIADSFTNSGVAPFYLPFVPITQQHWHFPLHIRTSTFADTVVVRLGALVLVVLGFLH
jgi:Predicted membrane-bound metal-dependent hydrolase (DUF457).